jgi:cell division protein FtsB
MEHLTSTIELLTSLQSQYVQTTQTTSSLHQQCERLVQEREQLGRMATGIEVRLQYFGDFDNVVDNTVTDPQNFADTLDKLDQSILFLSANMDYFESKTYLAKYKQLQARALANLRDMIVTKFKSVTQSVKIQEAEVCCFLQN